MTAALASHAMTIPIAIRTAMRKRREWRRGRREDLELAPRALASSVPDASLGGGSVLSSSSVLVITQAERSGRGRASITAQIQASR
jgi:hypothetical protein